MGGVPFIAVALFHFVFLFFPPRPLFKIHHLHVNMTWMFLHGNIASTSRRCTPPLTSAASMNDSRPGHARTPLPLPPSPPICSVIISVDARLQINARRPRQVRAAPKVDATAASVMNESRREPSPRRRPAVSSLLP